MNKHVTLEDLQEQLAGIEVMIEELREMCTRRNPPMYALLTRALARRASHRQGQGNPLYGPHEVTP